MNNINIIFFNNDSIIVISAIIVLSVFIYTFYDNIFTPAQHSSNINGGLYNKLKLSLSAIKYSFFGLISTLVDASASTVVWLTDDELNSLLQVVFREIGNSNIITVELLKSLGLYSGSVVNYLISLGYTILY